MEEIVDIVDEHLHVLFQTPKSAAHTQGLLHKCVVAEIIDSRGNWTLVEQASHKQDKGQLVSPVGGHVKAGEKDEDALLREVLEEVGISEFKYKLIGTVILDRFINNQQENHIFILYEIYSDKNLILNNESVSYKKFTKEELVAELKRNPHHFGNAFWLLLRTFYKNLLS